MVNITDEIEDIRKPTGLKKGIITVFVADSTAGITTFEYESGMIKDTQDYPWL
ncbi:MAG: YjbQ family protein [Candidatus Omnitrophica bacterium]|nr:YjbQ family protein [Candidatus Omnitrophota bacterium]